MGSVRVSAKPIGRGVPLVRANDEYVRSPQMGSAHSHVQLALVLEDLAHSIRGGGEVEPTATQKLAKISASAKAVYALRRKKVELLKEPEIAEGPAWDILLDLFINMADERPVSVTSAAIGASCPLTTAMRWLRILQDQELVVKADDPADKRRSFVELTDKGRQAVVEVLGLYEELSLSPVWRASYKR